MKLRIMLACLCASASVSAHPPVLVTEEPLPSVKVSYADLNLARPTDVDRLRARIRRAAPNLCFDGPRIPLNLKDQEWACFKTAQANASTRIDEVVAQQADMNLATAAQVIVVQAR